MAVKLPSFADVEAAARRIAPFASQDSLGGERRTQREARRAGLAEAGDLAADRFLQVPRRLQPHQQDPPADRAKGVVAFSSGNHAQGVAAAAALFAMPALIVMPKDAPAPNWRAPGLRRRDRLLRPRHGRPRSHRAQAVRRTRRDADPSLRRSRRRGGAGHGGSGDRRGRRAAGRRARCRSGAVQRRRSGQRHRAGVLGPESLRPGSSASRSKISTA